MRIVFIVGTSYSGSTLLSFVLNTHPQVLSIGEMDAWPIYPQVKCSTLHGFYRLAEREAVDVPVLLYNVPSRTGSASDLIVSLEMSPAMESKPPCS